MKTVTIRIKTVKFFSSEGYRDHTVVMRIIERESRLTRKSPGGLQAVANGKLNEVLR
jgi:hypothetical protein